MMFFSSSTSTLAVIWQWFGPCFWYTFLQHFLKPTDTLFWISGSTVLWTVAEPGHFSEEINSSTQSAARQTRRRTSVHHRGLERHISQQAGFSWWQAKQTSNSNDRMVDSDSSFIRQELCGKYQMIRFSGACASPVGHKTFVSGPMCSVSLWHWDTWVHIALQHFWVNVFLLNLCSLFLIAPVCLFSTSPFCSLKQSWGLTWGSHHI